MAKKAKHAKKLHRHKFRNAVRPHLASARAPAPASGANSSSKKLSHGQTVLYSAGGAAAAATACALIARQNILPATFVTGIVTAVGGTAAVVAESPMWQAIGQGAMAAAGAQLGLVLLDNHYQDTAVKAALSAPKPDVKKPANAENLPPGALEAAYERARRRLAMAEAASQMAA